MITLTLSSSAGLPRLRFTVRPFLPVFIWLEIWTNCVVGGWGIWLCSTAVLDVPGGANLNSRSNSLSVARESGPNWSKLKTTSRSNKIISAEVIFELSDGKKRSLAYRPWLRVQTKYAPLTLSNSLLRCKWRKVKGPGAIHSISIHDQFHGGTTKTNAMHVQEGTIMKETI